MQLLTSERFISAISGSALMKCLNPAFPNARDTAKIPDARTTPLTALRAPKSQDTRVFKWAVRSLIFCLEDYLPFTIYKYSTRVANMCYIRFRRQDENNDSCRTRTDNVSDDYHRVQRRHPHHIHETNVSRHRLDQ